MSETKRPHQLYSPCFCEDCEEKAKKWLSDNWVKTQREITYVKDLESEVHTSRSDGIKECIAIIKSRAKADHISRENALAYNFIADYLYDFLLRNNNG